MVCLPPPRPDPQKSVLLTLSYFDQFDYPLTLKEVWFWQPYTSYPITSLAPFYRSRHQPFSLRKKRLIYSQKKWAIAKKAIDLLQKIPTIQTIFVTGALAMDNSPRLDDIDIMVVTKPSTLWLTRPLAIILLRHKNLRRPPHLSEHSSLRVNNRICDNLWLDQDHLTISTHDLNTAHEILQAKCLFDRGGVHRQFLLQNSWAKKYLPIAYRETLKQCDRKAVQSQRLTIISIFLFTINYLLFTIQYLYMRSHLTHEKVGLGYAFFHPNSSRV
jgi:hypothetical protein